MSVSSFVPDNYTAPSAGGGNYTKLQPGENRLRVLADQPLIGWQYWNTANKPVRSAYDAHPGNPADLRDGDKVKQCWWMKVYNYATKAIEIWEVAQVGLINGIISYARHEDYGNPVNYGFTITKTGSGKETTYNLVAGVPKPLPAEIQKLSAETPVNLQALLENGGNPFDTQPAPGTAATSAQAKNIAVPTEEDGLPF